MTSPILVTGGTGTLGRLVVSRLTAAGRDVRVLTRRTLPAAAGVEFVTGNLATGAGLAEAAAGVSAIVHCASDNKGDAAATRNLVGAANPDLAHLVYISIVGTDLVGFGYVREKLESERIVASCGLPYSTLRATQFYDLIFKGASRLGRLPVVPVPARFPVQPVDTDEVAARLAELTLGEPQGEVPDMGGPQVLSFAGLLRIYLHVTGRRRPVLQLPVPGLKPVKAGALLVDPARAGPAGKLTWQEFLTSRVGSEPAGS
jgi:uncharacterized protein YbjT (DUF2867 family)